jgi:flagellar motility protein MotE (MotC chaperone)
MMTATVSALAATANGVSATSPQDATRLGSSIGSDLNARDTAAAQRKRALDMREQAAAAAEARIRAEAEANRKVAASAAGGPGAQPAEAQFDELARVYQAMKPASAAPIFEQLTMEVQLKVAQRMRSRSTAMLLAAMTRDGAAALSMALARGSAAPAAKPATQRR